MDNLIGKDIKRYHVIEQLGEGGMAIVYKAFDTRLEREVALKIIRKGAFPPEQMERLLKRFEREAKTMARLSHPNIVKVYDYGQFEGAPFLVMEFVAGGTLKQRLSAQKNAPMSWKEACGIVITIADALQYAHDRGLVHRDVKPSNILITSTGQAMLSDFGIVKFLDVQETHTLTGTGIGVGTPEYMSPEQWLGNVSPQSDQYSLGVVLYELVTGKKPYIADTPAGILLQQATEKPLKPSQINSNVPPELEKFLLQVLTPEPTERFPNIKAFADALNEMPGLILKETRSKRIRQGTKKLALVLLPSILVLGGFGILAYQFFLSGGGPKFSKALLTDTVTFHSPTPQLLNRATISVTPTSTPAATFTAVLAEPTALPQLALPLLAGMNLPDQKKIINSDNIQDLTQMAIWGSGAIGHVRWTADGQYLIVASTHGITTYDAKNIEAVRFTPTPAFDYFFSDDSSLMAFATEPKSLTIKDVIEDTVINTFILPSETGEISTVAFSIDDKQIAVGTSKGTIILWNVSDGSISKTFFVKGMYVSSLAFSPDGSELAAGSGNDVLRDFSIRLWNIEQGSIDHTIQRHTNAVTRLVYSPDGRLLASASGDGIIYLWQVNNVDIRMQNKISVTVDLSKKQVDGLVFSPEGSYFAYSYTGTIYLRQTSDGTLVNEMSFGDSDFINTLAFSPDGRSLASGSDDSSIKVWTIPDGTLIKTIGNHSRYISALAFSNDGSLFATGSGDGTIHFWHTSSGDDYLTVPVPSIATILTFNPTGSAVACGLTDGSIYLINISSGNSMEMNGDSQYKKTVAMLEFSQDGNTLASADLNGTVRLWQVSNNRILNTIDAGPANVFQISPDFSTLAANRFKSLYSWQLKTGELQINMKGQFNTTISLAFSNDGRFIYTGSSDHSIETLKNSNGESVGSSIGTVTPQRLIVSPKSSISASIGDGSVDLWVNFGNLPLRTLIMGNDGEYLPPAIFSPDGAYLVFGMQDGTVQLWGIP